MLLKQGSRLNRWCSGSADSVGAARRWVLEILPTVPEPARGDLAIIVSELSTNVVQHVRGSYTVYVEMTSNHSALISVEDNGDPSTTPRVLGRPEPDAPHGRGLFLVAAFSSRMGTEITAQGRRRVWAEVRWNYSAPLPRRSAPRRNLASI